MPLVELWDLDTAGIIILFPTGVKFSNQTGGVFCLHPEAEGCFVPLIEDYDRSNRPSIESALENYFVGPKWKGSGATRGIDQQDADFIDRVLRQHKLDRSFQVDRSRLKESHEAWIYVIIENDEKGSFSGFGPYPRSGVLTWPNSD